MEVVVLADRASKCLLRQSGLEASIPFFDQDLLDHRSYLAAVDNGAVVGLVGFREVSQRVPSALGVGFVSTHVDHRRRGIAKALLSQLYAYAESAGKPLALSSYEPDGERWLKPLVAKMRQSHPHVQVFEQ